MPLFLKFNIQPDGLVGIWQTNEQDNYFQEKLNLFPSESDELEILKNRKRTEWLSSRYLLHILSEREIRGACLKDKFGKPYLENSEFHISISHSSSYTGVIASTSVVGIDIQVIIPKIERITSKFVTEDEFRYIHNTNKTEAFHAIWGAKEAMYKAYGRKELDFKKHISVGEFHFSRDGFIFTGEVKKDDFYKKYALSCHQFDQLILVYAIEQ
ncbi:MAG: 4'-phosphopantetheinyl transferase superfamily protein [Saprospiraceae bacterium]|nr:4'-phosphopantetheinyl transferase superfamily protein [Saprospiraceae bacterium]